MQNRIINTAVVAEVARGLKELREQVVFVGGAVISLYTDDPAADEVRPTADIDMTIRLTGFSQWAKMQDRLLELGFSPNPQGHAICSYLYKDILVDVMPAEDSPIGPVNSWHRAGFNLSWNVTLDNETIRILSSPFFLASKFEAFNGRGGDYRTSHDFEDIIYVIDNRTTIVKEIIDSQEGVKNYLKSEIKKVMESPFREEIISSHIHPLVVEDRYEIVLNKMQQILIK